jgi:glucoamylase
VELPESVVDLYRMSAAVLAIHEDKSASGAMIASLSIPWGDSKGDHELGGYHLVWPRDLVNSAGALIALGHNVMARRTLRYLLSTQEADGHWAQNLWLDGTPYWSGLQMDEIAFPIVFAEMLRREGQLEDIDPWPMIRRAAGFLVRNGPVTEQDRWEENGGYSPFSMAVEISALLIAADFADRANEPDIAEMLRYTADAWNEMIERWTYVTDTRIAKDLDVEGYYVRIAPADIRDAQPESSGMIPIRNRPLGENESHYDEIVSVDALALVRFGLRDPNDPRIVNTVKVIDAKLRVLTDTGPAWYRYNRDGYGEKAAGEPFDVVGIGRPWPLLAGERAHYELAAGRPEVATQLLGVMRTQASDGGMLPEQVWDGPDILALELRNGRATGGAMPLVWAHAEYAKLVRSLHDGRVFDMPQQPYERYVRNRLG